MKSTIYDVAQKANVSIATVSKVINQKGRISEKTKERVKQVMKELDYQPNMFASGLMGKQTKTLGVIIPDLANPFFAEITRKIEDQAHQHNYNIVICSTDYQEDKENKYIDLLMSKRVDGFVLVSGFEKLDKVEKLLQLDIPVIVVARDFPMFPVSTVAIDDFLGGYKAANYLMDLGHTSIDVIALDVWSNRERVRGFEHALKENNYALNHAVSYINDISGNQMELAKNQAKEIIGLNKPTAIFACNDMLAAGVLKASKELMISVPTQLSVIGFDNSVVATYVDPPLTSIAQPIEKMCSLIMSLMVKHINEQDKEAIRYTLIPELVERESVVNIK